MKEKTPTIKAILSPEQVFQFLSDINDQKQRDIRLEECVRRLSMDVSTLNLN